MMRRVCCAVLAISTMIAAWRVAAVRAQVTQPRQAGVISLDDGRRVLSCGDPTTGAGQAAPPQSLCVSGSTIYRKSGPRTTDWTAIGNGRAGAWQVRATDAGALCDGAVDDLVALQAAVDALQVAGGGDLILPIGECRISGTLIVGVNGGGYSKVNLIGQSEDASSITFTGPPDRPAIFANHVAYVRWRNFHINSGARRTGSAIGILVGASSGSGTQATGITFEHIAFSRFHYGLLLGPSAPSVADASEFTCQACRFFANDVGATWAGYNTLNIRFYDVSLMQNIRGMEVGGDGTYARQVSEGPLVIGGDTNGNDECDFCIGNSFGSILIEKMRAEPERRFILGGGATPILTVRSNTATPSSDGVIVEIKGVAIATFEDNLFAGQVAVTDVNAGQNTEVVRMHRNQVVGQGVLPLVLPLRQRGVYLDFASNVLMDAKNPFNGVLGPAEDIVGMYAGSSEQSTLLPSVSVDRASFGDLALLRARSLAFGSPSAGRNLRDQVTFASSGTARFAFSRSITVDVTAGRRAVTVTKGVVSAVDLGKRVVFSHLNESCERAGADLAATIVGIDNPTHFTIATLPSGAAPPSCGSNELVSTARDVVVTVGEDEPDANWFPIGLVCDADARYWVTDVTASGATFHSSDPASTATCRFAVMR